MRNLRVGGCFIYITRIDPMTVPRFASQTVTGPHLRRRRLAGSSGGQPRRQPAAWPPDRTRGPLCGRRISQHVSVRRPQPRDLGVPHLDRLPQVRVDRPQRRCLIPGKRTWDTNQRRLLPAQRHQGTTPGRLSGQEVLIRLQARRFFCSNDACAKVTFAEQVPGLTTRYGRRTSGLEGMLQAVALALGGRAGLAALRASKHAACDAQVIGPMVQPSEAHPTARIVGQPSHLTRR